MSEENEYQNLVEHYCTLNSLEDNINFLKEECAETIVELSDNTKELTVDSPLFSEMVDTALMVDACMLLVYRDHEIKTVYISGMCELIRTNKTLNWRDFNTSLARTIVTSSHFMRGKSAAHYFLVDAKDLTLNIEYIVSIVLKMSEEDFQKEKLKRLINVIERIAKSAESTNN